MPNNKTHAHGRGIHYSDCHCSMCFIGHCGAFATEHQEEKRKPDGWAYRYPDGIRFTHGQSVNGCDPSESIPYYFGSPKEIPQ